MAAPPFLRAGWFAPWWQAFGKGTLELVTLRRDGGIAAAGAFCRRFGKVHSLTNYHTAEFDVLAEDETAASTVIRAIFARSPRSVGIWFTDADTGTHPLIRAAAEEHGYRLLELPAVRSPYVEIRGDWSAYERGLSANVRGDVRRRRRRLEEQGTVEIEIADGGARLDELLAEGYGVEGSGWKGKRHTAIASNPETHRFYTELARWAHAQGWLRLCFLRLDGRAIAFHFDLEAYGAQYHMKGGYDPAFERFSPSKVLHYALLERAFALGARRYHFLGTAEPYKLQFTRDVRTLLRIEAFASSMPGQLELALVRHGRPVAHRVRLAVRG